MLDDFIILLIIVCTCITGRLQKLGLITEYQNNMIKKWLSTSTKKAERRYQ